MDTTFETTVLSRAVHLHLREGRAPRARQLIEAWRERARHAAAPVALQSLLELASGNLEQAQALSREAIAADRNSAPAYAAAAHAHAAAGREDEALLCARTALNLDPAIAETVPLLAQLHLQAGQPAEALAALRRAAALDPPEVPVQLMLAELLLRSGEAMEEGERIARQVCQAHSHMAAAWALHALARAMQGDVQGARQELNLALALEPNQPVYLLELARLCVSETSPSAAALAEAQALARKAQALDPKEWHAPLVLSEVLRRQHQFMPALKVLSEATQALPERGELWMEFARVCGWVGQVQAAAQALDKAQALKVPAAALAQARFDLEFRRGDLTRGWACFEAADAASRAGQPRLSPIADAPDGHAGAVVGFVANGASHCLMFVRYMAALADAGIVAHLWAPEPLVQLLSRVRGLAGVASHPSRLKVRHMEPLTRAPLLLGMLDLAPVAQPYLSADPAVVEGVRMRRATLVGPVVVLDVGHEADPGLVLQLGQWLQKQSASLVLLRPPPTAWNALGLRCEVLSEDDVEAMAAWVAVADLVVGGDVPLSHLAGGMGRDAHVVLPIGHEAVWAAEGPSCAWYPSLRLYRESLQAGWGEAWPRLMAALDAGLAPPSRPGA